MTEKQFEELYEKRWFIAVYKNKAGEILTSRFKIKRMADVTKDIMKNKGTILSIFYKDT